jgi:hypothetical protein
VLLVVDGQLVPEAAVRRDGGGHPIGVSTASLVPGSHRLTVVVERPGGALVQAGVVFEVVA